MKNQQQQQKWRNHTRLYRQNHKSYSLSFPNAEAERLETLAQEKMTDTATFLKKIIVAHVHSNGFVLPPDGNMRELSLLIRRVASILNQTVRYIHTNGQLTYNDIQRLQQHLVKMEHAIEKALTLPPSVEEVLENHLRNNPDKKQQLIEYLQRL